MLESISKYFSRTPPFRVAGVAPASLHRWLGLVAVVLVVPASLGCGGGEPTFDGEVVACCARDRIDAEPILKSFEERTGIRVVAVFEDGATTPRLAARIESERERSGCDVFWNDDPAGAVRLARTGVFEPYESDAAEKIPERYRDPGGTWTGFAARARVVIYDSKRTSPDLVPTDLDDLTDERWTGRFAMARPRFGTTATHAAVLFADWGESRARLQFELLVANGLVPLEDEALVARAVAEKRLPVAVVDLDEAWRARMWSESADWLPLDHDGEGPLLIPDTAALVRGGPNPDAGRKLIDHLLSEETEARLASASARVPVRRKVPAPPRIAELARAHALEVEWEEVADKLEPSAAFLEELLAGP